MIDRSAHNLAPQIDAPLGSVHADETDNASVSSPNNHAPLPPEATAPLHSVDDAKLVALVVNDDKAAYQVLMQRYYTKIWRLSLSILKDEQEAEDAVQEIFLALWQNIKSWDPEGKARFSTWIYRVSFNKCIDIKRKKRPDTHGDEMVIADAGSETAYQDALQRQVAEKLAHLMASLPQMQCMALRMFYYDELNVAEIAVKLDRSELSIRSLLKRGKAALKDKMGIEINVKSADLEKESINILR